MKQKIGIMGGTFDPIHNGHIEIAIASYKQYKLDKILFMPTGRPPHKDGITHISDYHRGKMVELAVADYDTFLYSDFEIRQGGITYTAETLTQLSLLYPDTEFYYIVGSDSLCYMDKWYHPEIIFKKAIILAACRNTESMKEIEDYRSFLIKTYGADIRLVYNDLVPISSTQIRRLCAEHLSLNGIVPAVVEMYIRENQLYGGQE